MNSRILIVSNADDIHSDVVESKLKRRGATPFRINLDEFPRDFAFAFGSASAGLSCTISHLPTGDAIALDEVGAVWLRKPAKFSFLSDSLSAQEEAFAHSETEHLLYSLLYSIDAYWISHPLAIRGALWKGEQLKRAAKMGFSVPRSIMTNAPEAVLQFSEEVGGDLIFKTMSSPSLCAQDVAQGERRYEGLPTTRMTAAHMAAIDAVRQVPCLFQEHVVKKHELRVTVIGEKAFAARICSQDDARTQTDYRHFSVEIPYVYEALAPELEARCVAYVRSYGLEYGAMDLIVTPNDDVVFLENNPAGQFLFVEQLVPELGMTDALADLLVEQSAMRSR